MRRLAVDVLVAAIAAVTVLSATPSGTGVLTAATPTPPVESIPEGATAATVVRVVDGDTIRVEIHGSEETVRLILIDTPETRDPRRPVECFGRAASERINELLPEDQVVYLERDVTDRDRYGRLLRYVWVPSDDAGEGYLLNERLVREGYAALYTYPPDIAYVERIRTAQQAAVAEQTGLWGECGGTDTPLNGPTPTAAADSGTDAGAPRSTAPVGVDRDCSDFATQDEAEAFYEAAGGPSVDPHRLDSDGDGLACESLP